MKFKEKAPDHNTAKFVSPAEFNSKSPERLTGEFVKTIATDYVQDCLKKAEIQMSGNGKNNHNVTYLLQEAENIKKGYLEEPDLEQNFTSFPTLEFMIDNPELDHERIYNKVFKKYKNAMERKSGRNALFYEDFVRHFFLEGSYEETKIFGNDDKGYLLGSNVEGTFVPSHFAPASLKSGASLINDLNVNHISTCFFIPEDLRDTILKLDGWKFINYPIPMNFRGDVLIKYPVFNDYKALIGVAIKRIKDNYYKHHSSKFEFISDYKYMVRRFIRKISKPYLDYTDDYQGEILTEVFNNIDSKKGF